MSVTAPLARAAAAPAPSRPAEAQAPAADGSFNALLGKLAQPPAEEARPADQAQPADASTAALTPAPAAQATDAAKTAEAPDAGATPDESEDDAEDHDRPEAAASDAPAQGTPAAAAPLPPAAPAPVSLVAGLLLQAGIAAGGGRGTAAGPVPVAGASVTGSAAAAMKSGEKAGAAAGPAAAAQPPLLATAADASPALKPVDGQQAPDATSLAGLPDSTAAAMAGTPAPAGLSTLHNFATSMPAQAPAAGPAVTSPVYQASLASQPHEAAFGGELSAQVNLLLQNGGAQRAELRLNPAELGPILISLSITGQTADINFSAVHAATREGIERSMPALREMLGAQGLNLGQAGVSAGQDPGTGARGDTPRPAPDAARHGDARDAAAGPAAPAPQVLRQARAVRGMLDLYA